jgi:hypothetical protein
MSSYLHIGGCKDGQILSVPKENTRIRYFQQKEDSLGVIKITFQEYEKQVLLVLDENGKQEKVSFFLVTSMNLKEAFNQLLQTYHVTRTK